MSMQANNIVITGGNFNQNNYPNTASVIQKLYEHRVAKDAFYNSEERLEEADLKTVNNIARRWMERTPSQCPSILDQLIVEDAINDIVIWLQDQNTDRQILWLYDDDRRLSTLISQTVAEILAKRGELGAAYFFPDIAPGKSEVDASRIIPTIAYQLTRNVPGAATYIADTIVHNLEIFDLNVYEQVARLLVVPLKQAYQASGNPEGATGVLSKPIIIHGFEGCENAKFLTLFLDAFVHAWESTDSENGIPFLQKLLILGRPTAHFRECLGRLREGLLLRRPIRIQHWHEREEEFCRREQESRKREEELTKELRQLKRELKKQSEEVRYGRKTLVEDAAESQRTIRKTELEMDERQRDTDKPMAEVLQHVEVTRLERKSLHRTSSIDDSSLTKQIRRLSVERTELLSRLTTSEQALKTVALAVESSLPERNAFATRSPHTMLWKYNERRPSAYPARVSNTVSDGELADNESESNRKEKEMHKKVFKRYTVDITLDEHRGPSPDPYASPSRHHRLLNRDDLQTQSASHSRRKLGEESESEYRPHRKVTLNYESETECGLRRRLNLGYESDSDTPSAARPLYPGQKRYGLQSSGTPAHLRAKRDTHLSGASSRLASISERSTHGVPMPKTPSLMGNPNLSVSHSGLRAPLGVSRSTSRNKLIKDSLRREQDDE